MPEETVVTANREHRRSTDALHRLRRWCRIWIDLWREACFPSVCIHCKRFLHPKPGTNSANVPASDPNGILSGLFCPDCTAQIRLIRSPKCSVCGVPFFGEGERDHVCGQCTVEPRPFVSAEAIAVYDGPVRSVVHALKYDGNLRAARILGRSLYAHFRRSPFRATVDMIVPVPLHPIRLRKRGFNQSVLLIHKWEKWLADDDHGACRPKICIDALRRIRNTRPQMSLGRKERQTNLIGAFAVHREGFVKGKRVLLVDDVMTTGATVAECASVLLNAGAAKVDVLTVARTLDS